MYSNLSRQAGASSPRFGNDFKRREIGKVAGGFEMRMKDWEADLRTQTLRAQVARLREALDKIGYQPLGPTDASADDVLHLCVEIARVALTDVPDPTMDAEILKQLKADWAKEAQVLSGKPDINTEMLEALKGLMRNFVGVRSSQNMMGEAGIAADQARAVIAKAEG